MLFLNIECKEVIIFLSSIVQCCSASDDDLSWTSNGGDSHVTGNGTEINKDKEEPSQWQREDRNSTSYNNPFIEEEIKRLAQNILIYLEK